MKKKTFFLSSLVAVGLFVAALSFSSCNKEDVDYNSVTEPAFVLSYDDADAPKDNQYPCPWCGTLIHAGESCIHTYGLNGADGIYCTDVHCPYCPDNHTNPAPNNPQFTNRPVSHRHIFDLCDFGFAGHWHEGGSTGDYDHHTHAWD